MKHVLQARRPWALVAIPQNRVSAMQAFVVIGAVPARLAWQQNTNPRLAPLSARPALWNQFPVRAATAVKIADVMKDIPETTVGNAALARQALTKT